MAGINRTAESRMRSLLTRFPWVAIARDRRPERVEWLAPGVLQVPVTYL